MADSSLPPAAQTQEEQWNRTLSMPTPMTAGMAGVRYTPQMSPYQPIMFLQRVEVPHPAHRDYPMVERLKKETISTQQKVNRAHIIRMQKPGTQIYSGWSPPQFGNHLPGIVHYNKLLKKYQLPQGLR